MDTKKQWMRLEKLAPEQDFKGGCNISAGSNDHGIALGMYYKCRGHLLSDGTKLFERGSKDHVRKRL